MERQHGYSPAQWAFGKDPSWSGELWDKDKDDEDTNLAKAEDPDFKKILEKQAKANYIYEQHYLKERFQKAARIAHRKQTIFNPGDCVFAWRKGGKRKKQGNKDKGRWYGMAIVLGTQTAVVDNTRKPVSIIWIVIGGRLWRCAPQHLRHASEREVADAKLQQKIPWTFQGVLDEIKVGEFVDVLPEGEPDFDDEEPADISVLGSDPQAMSSNA